MAIEAGDLFRGAGLAPYFLVAAARPGVNPDIKDIVNHPPALDTRMINFDSELMTRQLDTVISLHDQLYSGGERLNDPRFWHTTRDNEGNLRKIDSIQMLQVLIPFTDDHRLNINTLYLSENRRKSLTRKIISRVDNELHRPMTFPELFNESMGQIGPLPTAAMLDLHFTLRAWGRNMDRRITGDNITRQMVEKFPRYIAGFQVDSPDALGDPYHAAGICTAGMISRAFQEDPDIGAKICGRARYGASTFARTIREKIFRRDVAHDHREIDIMMFDVGWNIADRHLS